MPATAQRVHPQHLVLAVVRQDVWQHARAITSDLDAAGLLDADATLAGRTVPAMLRNLRRRGEVVYDRAADQWTRTPQGSRTVSRTPADAL